MGPYSGFSVRALVFWMALALLAGLVYLRQVVDDEVRQHLSDTTEAAEQTSRRIEDFVQTLPPAAFQSELARAVTAVNKAVSSAMPRRTNPQVGAADLAQVVRGVLHSIASLAHRYDGQPLVDGQASRYSANVMLFVPVTAKDVDTKLRFLPPEYDKTQLLGALELRVDLSASSELADAPTPDFATPSICLPVPKAVQRGSRFAVLPGPPLTFMTGETTGYGDTESLPSWCETKGDFPPSVCEELRNYFQSDEGRRSGASFPDHLRRAPATASES